MAAILGFVEAAFLLLASLVYFTFSSLAAFLAIFGALFLALAAMCVVGGVQALRGRGGRVLLMGGGIAAGVVLLGVISALIGGAGLDAFSVLICLLGAAIVALLLQPQTRQYFAARGTR